MRALLLASFVAASAAHRAEARVPGDEAPSRFVVEVAKIFTGSDGTDVPRVLEPGAMLVVDGKIAAIGTEVEAPPGTPVLDCSNQVLMPGVVLATSTLAGSASGMHTISAQYDVSDSFDRHANYHSYLMAGITTCYAGAGIDRLVSGQGAVVKLAGGEERAQILRSGAFLDVSLAASSLRPPLEGEVVIPPASDNPIQPDRRQRPSGRISQLATLQAAFAAAARGESSNPGTAALVASVGARQPLRVVADREGEIQRALRFASTVQQPVLLAGLAEAGEVEDALAAARLPLVVELGSVLAPAPNPAVDGNALVRPANTAARLASRGLDVALSMPYGSDPRELLFAAATAVDADYGVERVVAGLTSVPARILGVGDRVGTLSAGRDADFLLLSAEPLSRGSHVQAVYVDGRAVASRPKSDAGQSTVLRAGTLHTGTGEVLEGGAEVLIRDGKIARVGRSVGVPPGAQVVDFGDDAVLAPGFIDCNSQIGLGADRAALGLDLDLTRAVAAAGDEELAVAGSGVTTVLLQDAGSRPNGGRVVPVKTAGATRSDRVLSSLAAVKIGWRGNLDPITTAEGLRRALESGKKYHETWIKYEEELQKWKDAQASASEEEKRKLAEAAKKEAEQAHEEVSTEKKVDPVTGKWELELSGGPMPEPMQAELNLKLEGTEVSGTFVGLFGGPEDAAEVAGTLSGKQLELELRADIPIPVTLSATLDAEDSMTGALAIGDQFNLDVTGKRTEKTFEEITVVTRRKKRDDSGKPQPPPVNDALEPYRSLFGKKTPVLFDVDRAVAMRTALPIFAEYELDVVLMTASELELLAESQGMPNVRGVVVSDQLLGRNRDGEIEIPAAEWSVQGVSVGLQSGPQRSSRGLERNVSFAVRQGFGPEDALAALTSRPAQLFGLADRVGALAAGLDADVVVFSGELFAPGSKVLAVFVDGERVEQESVQ